MMEHQILVIKQSESKFKNELFVNDIRLLGHLLNGIELLYKTKLLYSLTYKEFEGLTLTQKRILYKKEYRIIISRVNKNSPLEIELLLKYLNFSIDLINLFFTEEQQESIIKNQIGVICSIDFENVENKKLWVQIFSSYKGCIKIIRTLNLIVELK